VNKTILSLCACLVLCGVAVDVWAQGQGGGARRTERPARTEEAQKAAQAKQQAEQKRAGQQGKAAEDAQAKGKAAQDAATAKGRAAEKGAQGRGQGHQQQLRALEAQQRRHQAKHMERQARLARIRELAVETGDAEMIARVDKLMGTQQQVHQRKTAQIQQQKRAMTDAEAAPAPAAPVESAPEQTPPEN